MFEQIQFDLLRSWVMRATELPEVILAHQNAPRPDENYGLLNLTRSRRIGRPVDFIDEENPLYDDTSSPELPFFRVAVQEFEFTWSLHVYSGDPVNVANRLVPWQTTQTGRESLGALNMFRIADIQRIPEQVNENWNDRAVTELFVRSYVCTGTTNHGTGSVLLGRVPTDVAEFASVEFPGMTPTQTAEVQKP